MKPITQEVIADMLTCSFFLLLLDFTCSYARLFCFAFPHGLDLRFPNWNSPETCILPFSYVNEERSVLNFYFALLVANNTIC